MLPYALYIKFWILLWDQLQRRKLDPPIITHRRHAQLWQPWNNWFISNPQIPCRLTTQWLALNPMRPSIPSGPNPWISVTIGYSNPSFRSSSWCIFAQASQTFLTHSPRTTLLNTAASCPQNIWSLTKPLLWHVRPFLSFVRYSCSNLHSMLGCINYPCSLRMRVHSSLKSMKQDSRKICITVICLQILVSVAHKFTNNVFTIKPSLFLDVYNHYCQVIPMEIVENIYRQLRTKENKK